MQREAADHLAPVRVGERVEDEPEGSDTGERRRLKVERGAPGGRRLLDDEARAVGGVVERELDASLVAQIISKHSGQDVEQVLRDIDRDRFTTPEEAIEYGLIDAVMEPR